MALNPFIVAGIATNQVKASCELAGFTKQWQDIYSPLFGEIYSQAQSGGLTGEDADWFSANHLILRNDLGIEFFFTIGGLRYQLNIATNYAFTPGEAQLLYSQLVAAGYPSTGFSKQNLAAYIATGNPTVFSFG